jgi:hypothetical protein
VAIMIEIPTDMKPAVTKLSCHASPLWPAPVIGDSAAVPKTAANKVKNQLKYVPYNTAQNEIFIAALGNLT